jgi:diketogulonate reductase-like aldo/keto reductase
VLNTGLPMPLLGLGTYLSGPGEQAVRAVCWALEAGYRLIDTSLAYWNEKDVGEGLRTSGLPRDQVFLISKLENADQGYESTLAACARSLANLGTDYLDLYLIHWPVPALRDETWRAMERLLEEGVCRAVGVSNYTVGHLRGLLAWAKVVPAVNQVESHPFLQQSSLLEYCRAQGIAVQAYSPLVKARMMDDPSLLALARKHGKTPAQILLRFQVQRGVSAVPKSVRREKIIENIRVFDFSLDVEDLAVLGSLDRGLHVDWDPTAVG